MRLLLPFLIFLFLALNAFLAQNQTAAFYKLLKIIEFLLLGFYVARNHLTIQPFNHSVTLSFAIIFSSLIGIVQFIKQASLGGWFYWLGERTFSVASAGIAKAIIGGRLVMRPYATFPHPNALAGFILVSLLLVIANFSSQSGRDFRSGIGARKKLRERSRNGFWRWLGQKAPRKEDVSEVKSGFGKENTSEVKPRGLVRGGKHFRWLVAFLGIATIILSFSRSVWLVGLIIGTWLLLGYFRKPRTTPGWNLAKTMKTPREKNTSMVKAKNKKTPRMVARQRLASPTGGPRLLRGGVVAVVFFGTLGLLGYLGRNLSTGEAISQRLELAKSALMMVRDYPLAGVGLNNFIVRLPDFWQSPQTIRFLQPVHNIFLLVAAETGLVGLLIFIWFLGLTIKRLLNGYMVKWLKKRRGKKTLRMVARRDSSEVKEPITNYKLLITALVAILLLGLFDHYWLTLQQTQLLFTIILGLSWGGRKENLRV